MASLVIQLQQAALDPKTRVQDLLRLALTTAIKLGVTDIEQWLRHELDGYQNKKDLPPYRIIDGTPRARSQYHGWQNIQFADAKTAEAYSRRPVFDSISALEALMATATPGSYPVMGYPPQVENDILKQAGWSFSEVGIQLSHSSLANIVEKARTTVLDWALKLEQAGVRGEDLTFSKDEQTKAQDPSHGIVYNATHMTVVQTMNQSQIQQGSPGATQTFTVQPVDVAKLLDFISEARVLAKSAKLPAKEEEQLSADLSTLDAQAKAPTPSKGIVREAVESARKILESAAGSLTAANLPIILQKAATLMS